MAIVQYHLRLILLNLNCSGRLWSGEPEFAKKNTGCDFYVKTCSMGNDVTLMDKWYRKDTNKVRERGRE